MNGTVAVIMGVKNGPKIADAPSPRAARRHPGGDHPGRHHREPARPALRFGHLGQTIVDREVKPPAVLIIGDVVALGR